MIVEQAVLYQRVAALNEYATDLEDRIAACGDEDERHDLATEALAARAVQLNLMMAQES